MNAPDPAQSGKAPAGRSFRRLRLVGWIFVAMGALAILLPVAATVAAEALVAWLLVIWGVAGLWFAWEMRPAPEWRYGAATFALTLALGLVFARFPRAGIETLTIVMVLAFLMEGVVSILLGLRTSARAANWGWLVVNGLCSLAVGVISVRDGIRFRPTRSDGSISPCRRKTPSDWQPPTTLASSLAVSSSTASATLVGAAYATTRSSSNVSTPLPFS